MVRALPSAYHGRAGFSAFEAEPIIPAWSPDKASIPRQVTCICRVAQGSHMNNPSCDSNEGAAVFRRRARCVVLPALLLMGLTLLFLHKLVSIEFIGIGHAEDHLRQFYPYLTLDAEMLRSFSLHLWNPYTFGGFPYLASLRSHVFYPLNLVFLALPTYLGMNVNYILQVFLSGIFMYCLGRTLRMSRYGALASAISFMFCGFLIDKVSWGHLTMLGSACWLPLLFLLFVKAVEKESLAYAVGGGLVFAVQLSTGHPQLPYYGILTLSLFFAYSAARSVLKGSPLGSAALPGVYLLVLALVGLGLMAVQVIPAAELASHSLRSLPEDSFAFNTRWSMHPSYIATFILPRLAPVTGANTFPFPTALGYIGVLPLLLGISTLFRIHKDAHVRFFWIAAVFAIVLALGRYTPVYSLLYKVVPGFDSFRNPIFFLYIYVFSMCVLSGFGLSCIKQLALAWMRKSPRTFVALAAAICLFLLVVASATYIGARATEGFTTGACVLPEFLRSSDCLISSSLGEALRRFRVTIIFDFAILAIMLGAATLILLAWRSLRGRDAVFNALMVSLIFVDLFVYGRHFIRVYDLTPFVSGGSWVDYLKRDDEMFRVLPMLPYPEQDAVLKLNKIASINGYGSLEILQDYIDFVEAFQEQPADQDRCLTRVANHRSQAVNLFNTKYVLSTEPIEGGAFERVFTTEIPQAKTWDPANNGVQTMYVYRNGDALPRAFFVDGWRIIESRQEMLEALQDAEFEPRRTLLLEEDPGVERSQHRPGDCGEAIEFVTYEEDEFVLKAAPSNDCFLFLSEVYYPGWKVYVDERREKIHRANYLFRAVYLEEGPHVVRFVFDPASYRVGRIISLLTALGLIIYFSRAQLAGLLDRSRHGRSGSP